MAPTASATVLVEAGGGDIASAWAGFGAGAGADEQATPVTTRTARAATHLIAAPLMVC
jgi:hypothetical protein